MKETKWSAFIPWFLTIICTVSIFLVGFFLYENIEWFKTSALDDGELMKDSAYRVFLYSTHLDMLKRSLGIITGVAISFLGLGVSFYALEKESQITVNAVGKIASVSPGLIAIFLGCFLIYETVGSKDELTIVPPGSQIENKSDTTHH
jgi:hypothetical protein